MKKHLTIAGLLVAVALPACADGLYMFGDVGQSKMSKDGYDSTIANGSETDTTYSFGLGYEFNQTFSAELGYRDIGKTNYYHDQWSRADGDGTAIQISALAKYPLSDRVNVFGRLGFAWLTYDYSFQNLNDASNHYSHSDEQNKGLFGVGLDYKLNDHVSLRTEYNQYGKYGFLTTSSLTVGAVYSF